MPPDLIADKDITKRTSKNWGKYNFVFCKSMMKLVDLLA